LISNVSKIRLKDKHFQPRWKIKVSWVCYRRY